LLHKKEGRPDSVRIEYQAGLVGFFSEWIFPEATTDIQRFYYGKFMSKLGLQYEKWPATAHQFLKIAEALPVPKKIFVQKEDNFWKVKNHEY